MKKILNFGIAAVLAAGLVSCSDDDKILGEWLGAPTRVNIGGTADTQVTPRLTFTAGQDASEGSITIASDIAILDVIPSNDSLVSPYEISVAGTAEIKGTYRVADDDEILINLDNASLTVNIPSSAISFDESRFTQRLVPEQIEGHKTQIARRYESRVRHTLGVELLRYSRLDDVKFDKDLLTCEIDDRETMFRRAKLRE